MTTPTSRQQRTSVTQLEDQLGWHANRRLNRALRLHIQAQDLLPRHLLVLSAVASGIVALVLSGA